MTTLRRLWEKLIARPEISIPIILGLVAIFVTAVSVALYENNIRRLVIERQKRAISAGAEVLVSAIQRKMDVLDVLAASEEDWARALELTQSAREFENVVIYDMDGRRIGGGTLPQGLEMAPGEVGTKLPGRLSLTSISPNRRIVVIGSFLVGALRIEPLVNPEKALDPPESAVLFDKTGAVILATKPNEVPTPIGNRPGVSEAMKGNVGVYIHRQFGIDYMTAYSDIRVNNRPTGLGLLFEQPMRSVVDPYATFTVMVPFVLLLLAALTAFYLWLDLRWRSVQLRMRGYARAITETQETERARLARELHDDTIQNLVVLHQHVQAARVDTQKDPTVGVRRLETLRGDIVEMINNVRRYSHALRPIYLEESPLDAALDKLAYESNQTGERMHPPCVVKFEPGTFTHPINNDVKLTLFRIAQEAITNALKHSRAGTIRLLLNEVGSDGVRLTVEDDGRGFDKEAVRDGLGLVNIRERAAMIEAKVSIETTPGTGTRIEVVL